VPDQESVTVRRLTRRVAVVQWRGYWFTVSQVRWGRLRRWLYRWVYAHAGPPAECRFETAVFLSRQDGRFTPQKPLHTSYQKTADDARQTMQEVIAAVQDGQMPFQAFFRR